MYQFHATCTTVTGQTDVYSYYSTISVTMYLRPTESCKTTLGAFCVWFSVFSCFHACYSNPFSHAMNLISSSFLMPLSFKKIDLYCCEGLYYNPNDVRAMSKPQIFQIVKRMETKRSSARFIL